MRVRDLIYSSTRIIFTLAGVNNKEIEAVSAEITAEIVSQPVEYLNRRQGYSDIPEISDHKLSTSDPHYFLMKELQELLKKKELKELQQIIATALKKFSSYEDKETLLDKLEDTVNQAKKISGDPCLENLHDKIIEKRTALQQQGQRLSL